MRSSRFFLLLISLLASAASGQEPDWETAVNIADLAPGSNPAESFVSFNQPSINVDGLMTFRARSRVGTGSALTDGIYRLDLSTGAFDALARRGDVVPDPNNTVVMGSLATFNEFPSTPRIDPTSDLIASRGQHLPVWTYLLDGAETRVGTAGVFAFQGASAVTGASLLGAVVEADGVTPTFPWYAVPGTLTGTRFDQFPGSAAVTDGRYIVFKGNYTDLGDELGRTGVYFRDVVQTDPIPFTGLIANSDMVIPNQPMGGTTTFGSTAPPSAANGFVFFIGSDIEEAPTLGGIYRAPVAPTPPLQVLSGIGNPVPGVPGAVFNRFGEGLSVTPDGLRVSFWASWGTQTFEKLLECPVDGNPDLIAYCNELHPDGLLVDVPVNQGMFMHDVASGVTWPIARTGREGIEDFLFWGFSGRPPGVGGDEDPEELARWRSASFAALNNSADGTAMVAFKAERDGTRGIYVREGLQFPVSLRTVAEVGTTLGQAVDIEAPVDSLVSEVGVERDGYRSDRLAINVSMLFVDPVDPEETQGWAGIYRAQVAPDLIFADGFEGN